MRVGPVLSEWKRLCLFKLIFYISKWKMMAKVSTQEIKEIVNSLTWCPPLFLSHSTCSFFTVSLLHWTFPPFFYVFKALKEITKEEKLLRKLNSKTHLSLSLDKLSRGDYLLTTLPGYAGEIVINYFQWMNDSWKQYGCTKTQQKCWYSSLSGLNG